MQNYLDHKLNRWLCRFDYSTRIREHYESVVGNTPAGQAKLLEIRHDPRFRANEGRIMFAGITGKALDPVELAMWYFWRAENRSVDTAQQELDAFLDSDKLDVLNALWVLGLETKQTVSIVDGVELVPINDMPDYSEKEVFGQYEAGVLPRTEKPRSALVTRCRITKWHDPGGLPETPELEATGPRLFDVVSLFNALDGVSCIPYFHAVYTPASVPPGPFWMGGGGHYVFDVLGSGTSQISEDLIQELRRLLSRFDRHSIDFKVFLQRSLLRLAQAKRRKQIEDKLLDLGIALEMLLLSENRNHEQLSLSFRLRGAWLVGGSDLDERKRIMGELKRLYVYRSQVAHSGVLCQGHPKKRKDVEKLVPAYEKLASAIARKLIQDGSPEWDSLILGDPTGN